MAGRTLLLQGRLTLFDARRYLFARRAALLVTLRRPEELAALAHGFIEGARGDETAMAAVAARIIERYAQPLEAYAQGSSLREIAEPRELVHAFLIARFGTPASVLWRTPSLFMSMNTRFPAQRFATLIV